MKGTLTELEREIVELVARENWPWFRTDGMSVVRRENTGAGRYTYLEDAHQQQLTDGSYSAGGRMVEVAGAPHGLGFVVDVSGSKINYIEFFTFGSEGWDGSEGEWKIV